MALVGASRVSPTFYLFRLFAHRGASWTLARGVNPLDGTNYLDTVSAFIEGFLHLLAGEGVWGRGRHLSPFPQKSFRNLPAVLFVLKKHHRCASRFGRT